MKLQIISSGHDKVFIYLLQHHYQPLNMRSTYNITTLYHLFYYCPFFAINKRYFKIDQYLGRHFVYHVECLSSPPPFLCSQIITPFLNSMISTNQEKVLEFQPIVKPLFLFQCRIYFLLTLEVGLVRISMSDRNSIIIGLSGQKINI